MGRWGFAKREQFADLSGRGARPRAASPGAAGAPTLGREGPRRPPRRSRRAPREAKIQRELGQRDRRGMKSRPPAEGLRTSRGRRGRFPSRSETGAILKTFFCQKNTVGGPQERPKRVQGASTMSSRGPCDCPERPTRRQNIAPRRTTWRIAFRTAQEPPRRSKRVAKIQWELGHKKSSARSPTLESQGSKMPPRGSPEAPKTVQEAPGTATRAPRRPKRPPRSSQETFQETPRGIQEASGPSACPPLLLVRLLLLLPPSPPPPPPPIPPSSSPLVV